MYGNHAWGGLTPPQRFSNTWGGVNPPQAQNGHVLLQLRLWGGDPPPGSILLLLGGVNPPQPRKAYCSSVPYWDPFHLLLDRHSRTSAEYAARGGGRENGPHRANLVPSMLTGNSLTS